MAKSKKSRQPKRPGKRRPSGELVDAQVDAVAGGALGGDPDQPVIVGSVRKG